MADLFRSRVGRTSLAVSQTYLRTSPFDRIGPRSIDHLGELASVWLYRDDSPIKQITYREEPGQSSYTVTVRAV
jgi:hypothetical protein